MAEQAAPQQVTIARACVSCGSTSLQPHEQKLTQKRRPKFGVIWILATILTGGLALILWLVWPRHKVTVGVDRWLTCTNCGARQA
jgi:hypothetical protein